MLARISSADFVQTKGLPLVLCASMNSRIAASSAGTLSMHAAPQLLGGQLGEPALNEVQPGPVGRGEVDVEPRSFSEPRSDERGLMCAVVVHDEMYVEVRRHPRVETIEELAELHRPMAAVRLADDLASLHIERRKQRRRPVPCVIVGAAFGLARLHRQQGGRAVQRLDLRFLVDAQHDSMIGRIDIQPGDVPDFLDQQRVGRQLEGLAPMRAQPRTRARCD